jgi:hypothetical protein
MLMSSCGHRSRTSLQAPLLARVTPTTELGRAYQALLLAWDGNTAPGSDLPTVYSQWLVELARLPANETGHAFWKDQVYLQNVLVRNHTDPACTPAECVVFAARALDQAATKRAGVQWGQDVHKAVFAHEIFKGTPLACVASRSVRGERRREERGEVG